MAPLALITNWATRWRYLHQLQFWPLVGATCIIWKLGDQVTSLAFVQNLVIRWRHLHRFQSWPSGGNTCRCTKFGHQVVSLALPHCLGMPHWHYQLVLSLYLHHPESHQLSLHKGKWRTTGPNYRTPGLPGSDKKAQKMCKKVSQNFHKKEGCDGSGWKKWLKMDENVCGATCISNAVILWVSLLQQIGFVSCPQTAQ